MTKLLAIYLQDHHAGAVGGLALAQRAAGSNRGNRFGESLDEIADEIAADLEALEGVMDGLGISSDPLKDRAAWAGEKVGRLKRNGTWLAYSPLSRLVELEGLVLGVTGKLALWNALTDCLDAPAGISFRDLAARAEDQRDSLEKLRREAAVETFGSAATT